ncbi:MAG: xanthine dehydrogenase subunit XdhA [Eubacteriaceae bacterium]
MGVGKSKIRVDAYDKVTGKAKYTDDLMPSNVLVAKVVRSTIANGLVKAFDLSEAEKVKGVVKIFTCFDVPEIDFPTPGHPWSVEKSHQDISDRRLLNQRVRIYGDDIAAVIAENEVAAIQAVNLIKVEYEEYPVMLTVEEAMAEGATPIHEEKPDNVLVKSAFSVGEGTFEEAVASEPEAIVIDKTYKTQSVQHCHIEVPISYAYMESGRIVVVSSTQIPHIVRRVIGQAMGIPWGEIRVIKPYIGGGFGNKQEVLYEPLNAWLCAQIGGRPVKIELTREETFAFTRVRHAIKFNIKSCVRKDGSIVARKIEALSNQGGYASHGHAIVGNSINAFKHLYRQEKSLEAEAKTVYTNISTGGAMRGYGVPQISFAMESHMDDIANALGMDPLAFRTKNCLQQGYKDPHNGITCHTNALQECIEMGKHQIGWDEKRSVYANETGNIRRGVGMAIFSYKTGVYPISLETASARMVLNQDGSAQVQMGATEIGQGADTVFTQMASEACGISEDRIHVISTQDTDVTPFDTGAYASRQTYVSGMALKKTAELFKKNILDYAGYLLNCEAGDLDIVENNIIKIAGKKVLLSMDKLALEAFYSLKKSVHITAEATHHCTDNTISTGVTFAEVEVDVPVGKVKVLNIINVHDSGVLINPQLAEAQVHGGMSMGLGFGLSEQLIFDAKGRPLNNNLLDYKLPTSMDTPELDVGFIELKDPSGPFGNKSLGEPPTVPIAPAIRNAILHATGVPVDSSPINPQKLFEHLAEAGLIQLGEE